jgi:hypothetical protein
MAGESMNRFLTQGAKVSLVNQFSFLFYILYSLLLTVGMYFSVFFIVGLFMIGTFGTAFTPQLSSNLFNDLSPVLLIIIILSGLVASFLQSIGAAFVIGGLYGSTSDLIFEDKFSLKEYFYHSARNTWRLTGWQWVLFLVCLPFLILYIWFSDPELVRFPHQDVIMPIVFFVMVILLCYVFQYTPLFIVRYRARIWQSFGWSFRLIKRRFLSTVFGFLLLTIPNLLINLLYFAIAAGLVTVVSLLPFTSSVNVVIQAIIGIVAILFWAVIFFPFTITFFVILSIRHYRHHLEEALPEATSNLAQQQPFALKMTE